MDSRSWNWAADAFADSSAVPLFIGERHSIHTPTRLTGGHYLGQVYRVLGRGGEQRFPDDRGPEEPSDAFHFTVDEG